MKKNIPTQIDLTLPAPAKLNLFLHILGRRADGYHTLQTLFQFLDYSDTLYFALRTDQQINLHTPFNKVLPTQNLIVKAATLLQQKTLSPLGADIWIDKKLPMGGGLGGGSSNAATTLLALNCLWNTQLDLNTLSTLGVSLGADVPVFIQGTASFAEGIGERLTPANPLEAWYLITIPNLSISTADIFNHPQLPRNTPAIPLNDSSFLTSHNDCQETVEALHPSIKETRLFLSQFAPTQLTGTGACLFSRFDDYTLAENAQKNSPYKHFIAKGLNLSPLKTQLSKPH